MLETSYFVTIYFLYGLAFYSMGLLVAIEGGQAPDPRLRKALRPLAGFGLLHGAHEWLEMFQFADNSLALAELPFMAIGRIAILAVSFISLAAFGSYLLATTKQSQRYILLIPLGLEAVWTFGLLTLRGSLSPNEMWVAADVWTRYTLAIPAAILAASGLIVQQRIFRKTGLVQFGRDALWAAIAFSWYGLAGQLFVHASTLPPSHILNQDLFLDIFGFPVQLFRALTAVGAAIFIVRFLRSFQVEADQKMAELQAERLRASQQREALKSELYRRVIEAQEAERQRIARDLHDETGQSLTAIGLGLRGLSTSISQQHTVRQSEKTLMQLERMIANSLNELQRVISDLRPSHLDDLGLPATIRWYLGQAQERTDCDFDFELIGEEQEICPEFMTVMFRIFQEAITNVIKHADAAYTTIRLIFEPEVMRLEIKDNGHGFDLKHPQEQTTWGLLGMQERTTLLGGQFLVNSTLGGGTQIESVIPYCPTHTSGKKKNDNSPSSG
ncbi:MAG: sensor histidine kinase [Anaerolineae bacterium]|jgi:signal transduction histidine kinase|nr:sensor histidine kinase [Anaerolineae bacterium]